MSQNLVSHSDLPDLVAKLIDDRLATFKQEILKDMSAILGDTRVNNDLVSREADPEPRGQAHPTQTHDLQVLKTDSEILKAVDAFWQKIDVCGGDGRSNVIVVFSPQPPITTATSLHARLKALGVQVLPKGEHGVKFPWGQAGGQKGQPSVSIHFSPSCKVTAQAQNKQANLVVKGRKGCFSQMVIRSLVPFFGAAVAVKASRLDE